MVSISTQELSTKIGDLPIKMLNAANDAYKQVARALWDAIRPMIFEHWLIITTAVIVIFIITFIQAKKGRWGNLGKFLYRLIYFGIIFIILLIWGPEFFVENLYNTLGAFILYKVCYYITGMVLDKMRVKNF